MAGLETLIRVRQHTVDEHRRELAELYEERDGLAHDRAELDRAYERERALVEEDPQYRFTFAQYQKYYRDRCDAIDTALAELDRRITDKLDEIREAFRDLKQLEITKRERDRKAANERARIEQQFLDEAGLVTYQRQQDDS